MGFAAGFVVGFAAGFAVGFDADLGFAVGFDADLGFASIASGSGLREVARWVWVGCGVGLGGLRGGFGWLAGNGGHFWWIAVVLGVGIFC